MFRFIVPTAASLGWCAQTLVLHLAVFYSDKRLSKITVNSDSVWERAMQSFAFHISSCFYAAWLRYSTISSVSACLDTAVWTSGYVNLPRTSGMLLSSCGRCSSAGRSSPPGTAQHAPGRKGNDSAESVVSYRPASGISGKKGENSAEKPIAGHDICRTLLIFWACELRSEWEQQSKRRVCNSWQLMTFSFRPHLISIYQIMWTITAVISCQWPFSFENVEILRVAGQKYPLNQCSFWRNK